jgi:hypothetical protein
MAMQSCSSSSLFHMRAAVADDVGHGGVDDDVVGHVQVGDALARVDHGQAGAGVVHGLDVGLDLGLLVSGQAIQLGQHVGQPVVHVGADLLEGRGMLVEGVGVEDRHAVAEHDRVGDLHHGRLEVQRQQHAVGPGRLDLLGVEGAQGRTFITELSMTSPACSSSPSLRVRVWPPRPRTRFLHLVGSLRVVDVSDAKKSPSVMWATRALEPDSGHGFIIGGGSSGRSA